MTPALNPETEVGELAAEVCTFVQRQREYINTSWQDNCLTQPENVFQTEAKAWALLSESVILSTPLWTTDEREMNACCCQKHKKTIYKLKAGGNKTLRLWLHIIIIRIEGKETNSELTPKHHLE